MPRSPRRIDRQAELRAFLGDTALRLIDSKEPRPGWDHFLHNMDSNGCRSRLATSKVIKTIVDFIIHESAVPQGTGGHNDALSFFSALTNQADQKLSDQNPIRILINVAEELLKQRIVELDMDAELVVYVNAEVRLTEAGVLPAENINASLARAGADTAKYVCVRLKHPAAFLFLTDAALGMSGRRPNGVTVKAAVADVLSRIPDHSERVAWDDWIPLLDRLGASPYEIEEATRDTLAYINDFRRTLFGGDDENQNWITKAHLEAADTSALLAGDLRPITQLAAATTMVMADLLVRANPDFGTWSSAIYPGLISDLKSYETTGPNTPSF